MNVIYGKHDGCENEYIWEVSESMSKHIIKGDLLLVETTRGMAVATATSGVISGDGARDVAEKNKAYFPLKRVVSFVNNYLKTALIEKYKRAMVEYVRNFDYDIDYDDELVLPF